MGTLKAIKAMVKKEIVSDKPYCPDYTSMDEVSVGTSEAEELNNGNEYFDTLTREEFEITLELLRTQGQRQLDQSRQVGLEGCTREGRWTDITNTST